MKLSKKEIIDLYGKYNYKENEDEIMNCIDTIKTWEDFKSLLLKNHGILYWKGALRTRHYYDDLNSSKWKELFDIAKVSISEQKGTVKKIRNFSKENMKYNGKSGGISYPVASTLVYFFSKGECPIIDWRAIYTLKEKGYREQLKMKNLEIEKKGEDTPLRVLDKALWKYPDISKEERKKKECCSIKN